MASPESSAQEVFIKEVGVRVEVPRSLTEIRKGADNPRDVVAKIQRALAAYKGVNPGPIDGVFGDQSIAGLQAFQRRFGREVTTVVSGKDLSDLLTVASNLQKQNPSDFGLLKVSRAKTQTKTQTIQKKLTVDDIVTKGMVLKPGSKDRVAVRFLQLGLEAEGFDPKGVDGGWGSNTSEAYGNWQASMGKRGIRTGRAKGLQLRALVAKGIEKYYSQHPNQGQELLANNKLPKAVTSAFSGSRTQARKIGRFTVRNGRITVLDGVEVTNLYKAMSSGEVLRVGSRGPAVKEWRNIVDRLYETQKKNITGGGDPSYFSKQAAYWTRGVQSFLKLESIDGQVGGLTWNGFAVGYQSSPGMMVQSSSSSKTAQAPVSRRVDTSRRSDLIKTEQEGLKYFGFRESDLRYGEVEGAVRVLTHTKSGSPLLVNDKFYVHSSRGYMAQKRPVKSGKFTTSLIGMHKDAMEYVVQLQRELGVQIQFNGGSEVDAHKTHKGKQFDIQLSPKVLFAMLGKDGPFTLADFNKGSSGKFAIFRHKASGLEAVWERKNIRKNIRVLRSTNKLLNLAYEYERGNVSDIKHRSDGGVSYVWKDPKGARIAGVWTPDGPSGHAHFSVDTANQEVHSFLHGHRPKTAG